MIAARIQPKRKPYRKPVYAETLAQWLTRARLNLVRDDDLAHDWDAPWFDADAAAEFEPLPAPAAYLRRKSAK